MEKSTYELCKPAIDQILNTLTSEHIKMVEEEIEDQECIKFDILEHIDSRIKVTQTYDDDDSGFPTGCFLKFDGVNLGYFVHVPTTKEWELVDVHYHKTPSGNIEVNTSIILRELFKQIIYMNKDDLTPNEQVRLFEKALFEYQ
jgi:predicted AlkP superfamily phosphohydrolase/phosphomutase